MNQSLHFLRPYLRGWPIILVAMILAYTLASRYLQYVTPMYESTAKLRLADMGEGIPNSNLYKDFDVFANSQKINTEIEVIKSHQIIKNAIRESGFQCQLFRVGKLAKKELYLESPVSITPITIGADLEDIPLKMTIANRSNLTIYNGEEKLYNGKIGDTIFIKNSVFSISLNQSLIQAKSNIQIDDQYELIFNSPKLLISEIEKNLDVTAVDKDVSVIRISYKSPNPDKSAYFPNAIAKAYIEDYLLSKFRSADTTVDFLDERIDEIKSRLTNSENSILGYRQQKGITNIRQETETDLRKISQLKIQKTNLKMNLDATRDLERYIQSGRDNFLDLAPNFEAFNDLLSTEMVKKIKQLQSEKKDLELTYTNQDDRVKIVDEKINDITKYLVESIKNTRKNQEIKYNDICRDIHEAETYLEPVPENERVMTILNREFNIYEQSYNYLNQKRIEAEIAKSAKVAFHKVITPASLSSSPVSPNVPIVKIISTLLGMIAAIILIGIIHSLKARVQSSTTIESNSQTPIIAQIPKLKSRDEKETYFHKLITDWEIKKVLNSKNIVCISGFSPEEGSQFLAQNTINTFFEQNRNVLIIDFQNRLYPQISIGIKPIRIENNLDLWQIDKTDLKFKKSTEIQKTVADLSKKYDEIVILNDFIQSSFSLSMMSISTLNIISLDARLTAAKRVEEVDQLMEEFDIQNAYFSLNRVHYNPSMWYELTRWIRLRKKR